MRHSYWCCIVAALAVSAAAAAEKPAVPAKAVADQAVRIAVPYTAPDKGYVSLALYDQAGVLMRNLLCAQYVEKGARTATWDATTDLGLAVPAGSYAAKAVYFSEPPALAMIAKVGSAGNPPWRTPDGKGAWGGNLGPGTGICANQTAVVAAWVCVEDNQITGVQQMDADGGIQVRYSTFYPWDCRWACAMDERNLYLGILKGGKELQIAEYALGNPRGKILVTLPTAMAIDPGGSQKGRTYQVLNGMALTAERIYATVTTNDELFIIERGTGKVLDTVSVPGAHGVAVVKDTLLVVSAKQVLRYTLDGKSDGVLVKAGAMKAPTALCVGVDGTVYVADSGEGGTRQIHVFDAGGKPLRTLGKAGGAATQGKYDGAAGFGDGLWLCMGPGGKALFVNDVATGFPRTSRWSLTGQLEQEWFTGIGDNAVVPMNPGRPTEILKFGGEFDPSSLLAWEVDLAKKTWRPAWGFSREHAGSWHDEVIRGHEHGGNPLSKDKGFPGTWPIFAWGSAKEGGLRTFKGRNYMMSDHGAIYTYGPDAPPKLVAMAFSHRCEKQGEVLQTFFNTGPVNWLAWADRNGDAKPQMSEVAVAAKPAALADAQWVRLAFDDQLNIIAMRWTGPDYVDAGAVEICKLPLLEILPDGVPVYDWNKVESIKSLAKPTLQGGGANTVRGAFLSSLIDGGDSYYALIEATGDHPKLGGIDGDGWWASRNWRKKICRFDKATGACRWAVGRRTPGVAQPGEMYNPLMLAGCVGDTVIASDAMGCAWVWDKDGLYLGRLYNGPDDKRADAFTLHIELQGARVVTVGDASYIIANEVGTTVHEILLPRRQPLAVKPVTVTANHASKAKPWDPDGVTPTERPVYRVRPLAAHKPDAPLVIDGAIDPKEGWHGFSDGTAVDEAQVWMDGERVARVRALYDNTNLYLAYVVRTANGPVNAGSELPICPFVSGAYVDASFAPDWSQPQRPDVREGDVRLLIAQITGKGAVEAFQRGYWQKKSGGKGAQSISSPVATVRMEQIAEIPGLQQAWKVMGRDDRAKRVDWQVELAVPLAAIGLANPKGRSVGFDTSIGIANESGNGRERAAHWGGMSEATVVDRPGSSRLLPEHWGTLIFLER
ncbi:MAG: hypothetical protein H0W72_07385 [Planctomycetes bacterium]|nr:hypothetical protein [Planctomycetota bacterium]